MKHIFVMTCIFIAFTIINTTPTQAQGKNKSYDEIAITVEGLGCPFCAYGLEKKFKEFKGIKNVNIDMETGLFTFSYPSDKPLSIQQLEDQVEAAGYTAVHTIVKRASGEVEETGQTAETIVTEESVILEDQFFVSGNCGMCQSRIENAALAVTGVISANWDKKEKVLDLNYDSNQTSVQDVEKAVAQSGHDTPTYKAETEVYDNLPGCCQYDRL